MTKSVVFLCLAWCCLAENEPDSSSLLQSLTPRGKTAEASWMFEDDHETNLTIVTSAQMSFLQATEKHEQGVWVDLASKTECQKKDKYYRWFGTAPWCSTSKDDCHDHGMEFERFGAYGSSCWSGEKVLCSKTKTVQNDECNYWCLPGQFNYYMHGTAPMCSTTDCDCWRQGQIPIHKAKQFSCPCHDRSNCPDQLRNDGNNLCLYGEKQFCVKPIAEMSFNLDMVKSCDNRSAESQATMRAAMDMVAKIATAGATAIAEVAKAAAPAAAAR